MPPTRGIQIHAAVGGEPATRRRAPSPRRPRRLTLAGLSYLNKLIFWLRAKRGRGKNCIALRATAQRRERISRRRLLRNKRKTLHYQYDFVFYNFMVPFSIRGIASDGSDYTATPSRRRRRQRLFVIFHDFSRVPAYSAPSPRSQNN
ncbi:hypothetical protein EVAR_3503_1 [Eumeta japonica]|uniref:Uncharacterized protein n=1 Tax=Eumeta variegata TaxID=151549 RepID=A0A4C1YXL4_EUMVA|nr:hypothetical protein EVAR_3503_1 [Eumeta japonica]